MTLLIRPLHTNDQDKLVQLTLLAFEPIFSSFAHIMGNEIFPVIYPDWKKRQSDEISTLYTDKNLHVWVAEVDDQVAGVISYTLNEANKTGTVEFLVVSPTFQNDGIGTTLNNFVLEKMKVAGMEMAVVGTGGDPAHAPARRSYEKAGYTGLPLVRFYKKL